MKKRTLFNFLILLLITSGIYAQVNVTGKIIDEDGLPAPGASIIEAGTQNGTTTDFDGNFKLKTKSNNGKIVISFVGYKNQEINFSPSVNKFNNIKLQVSDELLGEVVVIGYGSQKKEDLSTAIATVSVDETLKSRPQKNVESLLQGQLAGVTIQTNSGNPYDNSSVNIRGIGSPDGNTLYVVDGVPNAPFNVEDVESVSVLKDAASAAVYGAFVGGNGVVVITTKKAKEGIHVTLNSSQGIANVTNLPKALTQEEYFKLVKIAYDDAGEAYPQYFNEPYFQETRTDWFKEIFRTGFIDHHAVSVSGGNDKVKALASFSYDNNEGTLLNTYKETIGAMLKVDFTPAKWLNVSERLSYKTSNGQGNINTSNHEGVITYALLFPRSSTPYEYDDNNELILDDNQVPVYHGTSPRKLAMSAYGNLRNPFAILDRLQEYRPTNKVFSTTGVDITPIKGLTFSSDYTFGIDLERFEKFQKKIPESGNTIAENYRSISNFYHREWLWENMLNYKKKVANHNFDALVGFTANYKNDRSSATTMSGFSKESIYNAVFSQGEKVVGLPAEGISEETASSFISRLNYNFANRYFLIVSSRKDETSKLQDNRSQWFTGASAAWKISSESFFSNLKDKISLLKLRASWGQTGNVDAVPRTGVTTADLKNSDWISYFGPGGTNGVKGIYLERNINPKLKWETTEQLDLGLDMQLFKSLDITFDYFEKITNDLIIRDVNNPLGLKPSYVNDGKVRNTGFELGLKFNHKINDFKYGVYGNFTHVDSKVIGLNRDFVGFGGGKTPFSGGDLLRSELGTEWYSYYLIKNDGIFKSQQEIDDYIFTDPITQVSNKIQPDAKPGDLKFIDKNNDGNIDDNDKDYVGSYMPKITYAFGANFDYKGFDFGFNFQGVAGNKILNIFKAYEINGTGQAANYSRRILDSYHPVRNPNSNFPRVSIVDDNNGNLTTESDFFVEDGSYLRLKNVTLGYTVPVGLMNKLGIENGKLRFYVNAENVFTITDYSGIDPEVGNNGIDAGQYPISRTLSVGLNFNF